MDDDQLTGRTALVVGGAGGIGAAIAAALHDAGARVATTDLRQPDKTDAHGALHVLADAADPGEVQEVHRRVSGELGPVDLLVLAAGIGVHERLDEGDPGTWAQVLRANVMGALAPLRAFLGDVASADRGDVVLVTSVAADTPYERGGPYGASKAALAYVADVLRLETPDHVRVVEVAPGVVDTAFFRRTPGHVDRAEEIGIGALSPEAVAAVVRQALERPRDQVLSRIEVRPAQQRF